MTTFNATVVNRSSGSWRGILVLAAALLVSAMPVTASAHPRLTKSVPGHAERLTVAPLVVRLWFSEAPELTLTSVTLTDSAGRAVAMGVVSRDDSSKLGVQVRPAAPLAAGTYTVRWRTAASDGHPTHGDFTFSVLPASGMANAMDSARMTTAPGVKSRDSTAGMTMSPTMPAKPLGDTTRAMPPDIAADMSHEMTHHETIDASGVRFVAVRFAMYGCLLLVVAAVMFETRQLGHGIRDVGMRERLIARTATIGAAAASALVLVALARLALQWQLLNANADGTHTSVSLLVRTTQWGTGWMIQIGVAILASASFLAARRIKGAWRIATALALVLCVTPALGGHAAASPQYRVAAIAADAAHVLFASGWLGGVMLLVFMTIPFIARHGGASRWNDIATAVHAFSPLALTCAAFLVVTGSFAAWLHVGSWGALSSSGYGRTLLTKLALVAGMMSVGAFNLRRRRPRLGNSQATASLQRSAALEVAIGVGVIIVTAILVAVEPPVQ